MVTETHFLKLSLPVCLFVKSCNLLDNEIIAAVYLLVVPTPVLLFDLCYLFRFLRHPAYLPKTRHPCVTLQAFGLLTISLSFQSPLFTITPRRRKAIKTQFLEGTRRT